MPNEDFDYNDVIQMDTLDATPSQDGSFIRPTSPARQHHGVTNYVVGILLLLVVVFLWTASNFVTQVRMTIPLEVRRLELTNMHLQRLFSREDTKNLSCELIEFRCPLQRLMVSSPYSLTYLSTSSFALYLVPSLVRQCRHKNIRFWDGSIHRNIFNRRGKELNVATL
jgi:solute carrier family 35 protein F5